MQSWERYTNAQITMLFRNNSQAIDNQYIKSHPKRLCYTFHKNVRWTKKYRIGFHIYKYSNFHKLQFL